MNPVSRVVVNTLNMAAKERMWEKQDRDRLIAGASIGMGFGIVFLVLIKLPAFIDKTWPEQVCDQERGEY